MTIDHAKFAKDAAAQNNGGTSNYRGITFQIFASAIQLARFAVAARKGRIDDVYFHAENPDSRVDDLHVVSATGIRWHYQMKSVGRLGWNPGLKSQLNDEAQVYPTANLFLVTDSKKRADVLVRTASSNGMDHVNVDFVDFSSPETSHQQVGIRRLIDDLSPVRPVEDTYLAIWRNIVATWFMAGKGTLSDLMRSASTGSMYTIGRLQEPSLNSQRLLASVAQYMTTLKVEVSKGVAVVSDGVMLSLVPIDESPDGDHWWLEQPEDEWAFYEILGGFRDDA